MGKEKDSAKDADKDDTQGQKKEPSDEQMYSALSFAVMLVLVGIPLWWKTTEVYRVSLPYTEIDALDADSFKISLAIHVATLDQIKSERLVQELGIYFERSKVFNATLKPEVISKSILGACKSLQEVEEKIQHPRLEGSLQLLEVPGLSRFTPRNVIIGQNRTVYFSSEADATLLFHTLETQLLQEDHLHRTVLHVRAPPEGKLDAECSRRVSPAATFDILLTVLHPEPEHMTVNFDLPKAIHEYMDPLLDELRDLNELHVKSQWLYLVSLQVSPKLVDGDSRHFALPEASLAHVITPLEKKLSSHVSARPCLNLVLWVPPCTTAPLHIYSDNGQRLQGADAFLSPRWGGIQIFNPPRDKCGLPDSMTVTPEASQVMPIFLQQLRLLLGIASLEEAVADGSIAPSKLPIRPWEKDCLLRSRTVEQLTIAKRTLQSLSELLGKISNIVINDNIGAAIYGSLEAITACEASLRAGRLLEAYRLSQHAYLASEAAFTDPSLLALLYFPEDQKYAVYIPLFLPVMIPVLISFKPLREWVTRKFFSVGKAKNE